MATAVVKLDTETRGLGDAATRGRCGVETRNRRDATDAFMSDVWVWIATEGTGREAYPTYGADWMTWTAQPPEPEVVQDASRSDE
jgi:hypothetical protein